MTEPRAQGGERIKCPTYQDGYVAYAQGEPVTANPFPLYTLRGIGWDAGWRYGESLRTDIEVNP